jgi:hypothetical protein
MDKFEYLPTKAKPRILQIQSILGWLYRALSLGLVSYTGSHACDFDLSVFKRERATFLIDENYIFRRRALACLNDFVGSSVWILGPPHNIATCYLVSITPQDFVDLWVLYGLFLLMQLMEGSTNYGLKMVPYMPRPSWSLRIGDSNMMRQCVTGSSLIIIIQPQEAAATETDAWTE